MDDTSGRTASVELCNLPNQNAGTRTFDQVIAAPDVIGLVLASDIAFFTSIQTLGFSSSTDTTFSVDNFGTTAVPIPAAIWLFGSGLLGLIGVSTRKKSA